MPKKIIILISVGIFLLIYFSAKYGYPKIKKYFSVSNEKTFSVQKEESAEKEKGATPHPDSIPAMAQKEFQGNALKLEEVLNENEFYTRYRITYRSEGFLISGIMNVPKGDGPFPVLILNHGYIDPKVYTNGQGLRREQDFFARNGYVVLHSDYRSHAESDFDPSNEVRPRSGYVEDVINAVSAIKKSNFDFLDKENIGMLGHSMGGGITENIMVTKPEIAKAFVLLAPINSSYKVNFDKWVKTEWPETAKKFYQVYGTYEKNPQFWESISAINYIGNIQAPVMLHQGTTDGEVPVEWSRDFSDALKKADKNITYYEYPGEPHIFGVAQPLVMQRTLKFFDQYLKR
ncbi:MAG: peptidase S9 prolyl oligopeptidase active site protein [uncultured bacterium]|nr:MAG: peptidase S9 prolyl oligopeptidase active site protein [uncultured bacterium]